MADLNIGTKLARITANDEKGEEPVAISQWCIPNIRFNILQQPEPIHRKQTPVQTWFGGYLSLIEI